MKPTADGWRRLWDTLGAREIPLGLFNQLVAAYSEPHRHYHTLQHLRECLAHLDAAASLARRPEEVEAALWFHDAVYDPARDDNEARSAAWARASVRAAGCGDAVAERVHALVLSTRGHAASEDADTALLLDIDLAILGAAPERFAEYERQVRVEYAHVPEPAFRSQVLAGFLARPTLYLTEAYRAALEQRARGNLAAALAALRD